MTFGIVGNLAGIGSLEAGEFRLLGVTYLIKVFEDGVGEGTIRADFSPLLPLTRPSATLHLNTCEKLTLFLHEIDVNEDFARVTTEGHIPGF